MAETQLIKCFKASKTIKVFSLHIYAFSSRQILPPSMPRWSVSALYFATQHCRVFGFQLKRHINFYLERWEGRRRKTNSKKMCVRNVDLVLGEHSCEGFKSVFRDLWQNVEFWLVANAGITNGKLSNVNSFTYANGGRGKEKRKNWKPICIVSFQFNAFRNGQTDNFLV